MWKWIFSSLLILNQLRVGYFFILEAPQFIQHPKPMTYFSNSVGLNLECVGRGQAPLKTKWLTSDGNPITEIPGLREITRNNSLHLLPFGGEDFLGSVHETRYRCCVTNDIGTVLSPIFAVQSIIDEQFEVFIKSSLEEDQVVEGNPIVLNCHVKPTQYKEFTKTIQWKSIDKYGYETEIASDGKLYQISAAGGSLVIFAAKYQQLFICLVQNSLNKKIQSSSPFMVKPKGAGAGRVAPRTVGNWERLIFTEIGKTIDLFCLSQGNPTPSFRWDKLVKNKFVPVISEGKTSGPLLSFEKVTAATNGTYRCESMNSLGSVLVQVDILVPTLPQVHLNPKKWSVSSGQNIDLKCETTEVPSHAEITWFHNGRVLLGGDSRIQISPNKLSIQNIKYSDQGVYQCFIDIGSYQIGASSTVLFPASEPELIHTFISQTLQPGPTLSLKCSGVGNPVPIISWYVDGRLISPAEQQEQYQDLDLWRGESNHYFSSGSFSQQNEIISHLNISRILPQHSGDYKCQASNSLSSTSHSARLNVYGKLFIKEMRDLMLAAGTTAFIPCLYGGYPVDKIIWRLNGSEIDTNKARFRILSNGTLQIENIKPEDRGKFSCKISNRNGETAASGFISVNVLQAPVISSFSFDDNLQEGQRTSISCTVISGDLPIDITWTRNSQPIHPSLNITSMRLKFLSNLIFEELKGEHSGEYTCVAYNAAATVNFSASLVVKVAPKWLHAPMSSEALLKSDLIIPCHAVGTPRPVPRWFKESSSIRSAIRSNHKFQIGENGTLTLFDLEVSDAGFVYTCEASNEISTIQKSIRISVIVPAQVFAPTKSIVVAEGLPAILKCQIRGDGVQVVWRKNSIVMEEHGPRVTLQTVLDANSSVLFAELKIKEARKEDTGAWSCLAVNQYGRDEDSISLTIKARPRSPADLTVEEIDSRSIGIKWSLQSEILSEPVTKFLVQYKNSSGIPWESDNVTNITVQAPANSANLRFLNPVTNYEIRVLALNEIGRSLPSPSISVSTLAEAPSGPPLNVSAISTSSRGILVNWEQPLPYLHNGPILGYHVLISNGSSTPLVIDEKWGHQTEINELKPNSRYRISIRAYNSVGMGPESPFISITTPEGAPDSPPLSVLCESLSPKSLLISWQPPPHHLANGIIQGYKVIYSSVLAELQGEKPEVKKTLNIETTLHGLSSYTNYSIRTLSFTKNGESSTSDPVFCTTEEDFSEEPAEIKVLANGHSGAVTVSWLPPHHPNGRITKYRVAWRSAEDADGVKDRYYTTSSSPEDQMVMEIRRLKENKKYTFWVTPATSLGLGKSSETVDIVVSSKAPAKIASFPVTRTPKLEQSVSLPCRAVGSPFPETTWWKGSSTVPLSYIMRNGSIFIPRVKDVDEGLYFCRVQNDVGADEIQHQIQISRPPSSVSSILLSYVSSNSIQVHWEPVHRAEPVLTGYLLQYKTSSSMDWISKRLGSRLTSFSIENLYCGTSYQIRIAAENRIGLGDFSPILKVKTNGNPPEYPKLTQVIDGNGTMVRFDLSRWPDGGCHIKKFRLEFKNHESQDWNSIHRNNSNRIFILNTTIGMKYDFRVSLENDAGAVSKTFSIESSPQFFTNYDKLMQNEESVASGSMIFSDPHILIPIVSAVFCTIGLIICIFIVLKRKSGEPRDNWKLGNSSSQQTWLSSDNLRADKSSSKSKLEDTRTPESSGIYATLNSRTAIPMTIRDSTFRLQTFGQADNYDAPPIQTMQRLRGTNSFYHEDEQLPDDTYAVNLKQKPRDMQDVHKIRKASNYNEYSIEEICNEYAHPYQVVPMNRGPLDADIKHTLRKQKRRQYK